MRPSMMSFLVMPYVNLDPKNHKRPSSPRRRGSIQASDRAPPDAWVDPGLRQHDDNEAKSSFLAMPLYPSICNVGKNGNADDRGD